MRHLFIGLLIAVAAAGIIACSSDSQPAQPTPVVDTTVDRFIGAWSPNDGTPSAFDGPDNTADSIVADGACRFIEFKVDREPDAKSAKIAFAARCANARIRGVGAGMLNEGVLHWRARGDIALPSGEKCQFSFGEGSKAVRVPEGLKVHYDGTVCGVPVIGTQIVKKKQ
jgi:hypothetical protein